MMNLDLKAIYKLTKVKTDNPNSRYAKDGDSFVGQARMYNESLIVGNLQTRNSVYSLVKQD
jgi:hypothetical protein